MATRTKRQWRSDLPSPRRGKYDWEKELAELRTRPGEWMLLDDKANVSLPGAIARKRIRILRDEEWDYHVRSVNNDYANKTCEVWMSATRKDGT